MGVLSEKMSSDNEQVEGNDPDPEQPSFSANTDGVEEGGESARRASPVSSEGSTAAAAERLQVTTLGSSLVDPDAANGAYSLSATKPAGEAVTKQPPPTHSADNSTANNDSAEQGKARACRSVSQDHADEFVCSAIVC